MIDTAKFRKKSVLDRAKIKATEIAKLDFAVDYSDSTYGVKVEIQSIKDIEDGIEIMARAWKGTKRLGFGKDGTVDIERFKIYNPPILVDDPNGDIVREWTDLDTGELKQRKLREDPIQAIRETLTHTISVLGKESDKIVKGKIGNTTSTFFPAAGLNSPVDGIVRRNVAGEETWATIHDAADAITALAELDDTNSAYLRAGTTTDQYKELRRGVFLFDTAALGDSDTIDSATFSLFVTDKADNLGGSHEVAMIDTAPASDDDLVVGDYTDGVEQGTTKQATNLTISGISTSAYNDWTLNATGEGNINKTGLSKFGVRLEADRGDVEPTWGSGEITQIQNRFADFTGTSSDPKLVVEHTGDAVGASKMLMGIGS